MKLKQIFIAFLSVIALYSCSEKEDIPADADDNFITKVTVSVAGETYSAVIASDTITVPDVLCDIRYLRFPVLHRIIVLIGVIIIRKLVYFCGKESRLPLFQ